jgi:predicted ArsR family transcriptional regulator
MGVVFITAAPSPPDIAPGADPRTRDRVLRRVSELGPVTAATLARSLGLTATGVRRHLDGLVDSGWIQAAEVSGPRRGRGRPARAYIVTDGGHRHLNASADLSGHQDDLATSALRFVAQQLGAEAVATFARQRVAELEQRYAAAVAAAGAEPAARAQALAHALAVDGFSASARRVPAPGLDGHASSGTQLCQGHCPMQQVAAAFPQLCEAETDAFARLLGVHVQRLATLANGEHVCTTFVPDRRPTGLHDPDLAPQERTLP